VITVSVTVTADILPSRHLIALAPAFAGPREASPAPRAAAVGNGTAAAAAALEPATGREPTPRECEVLGLLAAGATDGRIASLLELSPATVQTHVRNAKAKLGARTRTQAVALALQRGLISPE
jgi:DNA-binding NarL/FixJ family response regulator